MQRSAQLLRRCGVFIAAAASCLLLWASSAQAGKYTILYSFSGVPDGWVPVGALVEDSSGNLYGATKAGGYGKGSGTGCKKVGCGTIFELAPGGSETVLYRFSKRNAGAYVPFAGVISDTAGHLYGTTSVGGTGGCLGGCGTVFRLSPNGKLKVLHSFMGGADGYLPWGGLVADSAGNLYGTTYEGGGSGCYGYGCGTVFAVAPDGAEKVLYAFAAGNDGGLPLGELILDKSGNLYGTTTVGGGAGNGGTVFKIAPDGTETVLHAFAGGSDGQVPSSTLVADAAGNLYGTTRFGGSSDCGTVFELATDGTESVIYAFTGGNDGSFPLAGLVIDSSGNLFGTTSYGGGTVCYLGCGTVFKIAADGTETVQHAFSSGSDGAHPSSVLTADPSGKLYGTTGEGGTYSKGMVFAIKP